MTKLITIAKIIKAHGIKGEVKVISFCDDPIKIEEYPLCDEKGNLVKLKISNKNKIPVGFSSNNPIYLAQINDVNNRNDAENLSGVELFTDRENFPEITNDDEFYCNDLIGLEVMDQNKNKLGKITNILDHGAGAFCEIEFNKKAIKENYEKIENIPFKDEFFPTIDVKNGVVIANLPDIVINKDK